MTTFWKTIAAYNTATWIYQLIIIAIGLLLTFLLIRNPQRWVKTGMKLYLISVYTWIAVIYYHIYSAERNYHNVMSLFWGVMTLAWIWDMTTGYTPFERNRKCNILAYVLITTPLLYPIFSLMRGLNFPEMTSPVMPCSIVTFTMGLLLLFSRKVNLFIVLLLCHWSLIGLSKTYFFNIPEDFILASTSVPALYLFFKEYFLSSLPKGTKPEVQYIKLLLKGVCAGIGVLLVTNLLNYFL